MSGHRESINTRNPKHFVQGSNIQHRQQKGCVKNMETEPSQGHHIHGGESGAHKHTHHHHKTVHQNHKTRH